MNGIGTRSPRGGLSLVEVIVAMLLLMIGLLGVVSQWPLGTRMIMLGESQTEASVLAEQYLEMLNGSTFPPPSGTRNMGNYAVQWTVSAGPHAQTRLVVVTVRWNWQGRQYQVRMPTILAAEL